MTHDVTSPVTHPRARGLGGPRLREFGLLLVSISALQASRFFFAVLVARVLSQRDFTTWSLVLALATYAPSVMLGAGNGMNRLAPLLRGAGRPERAAQVEDAAWTVASSVVAAAAIGAIAAWLVGADEAAAVASLLGMVCIYQVQQFTLRSRLQFRHAAFQQLAFAGAVGIGCAALLLVPADGIAAVVAWYVAGHVIAVLVGALTIRKPIRIASVSSVRYVVSNGFPIMLAGLLFGLIATADRWIAATLFGATAAAPYAMASLISAAVFLVPTVIGQQTYPRMAQAVGAGAPVTHARMEARAQGSYAFIATAAAATMLVAAAFIAVPRMLPEYSAALPLIAILGGGLVLYAWFTGWGNYLTVMGRQWDYLRAQLTALVVGIPLMVAGGAIGGAIGLALAVSTSLAAYGILLMHMSLAVSDG